MLMCMHIIAAINTHSLLMIDGLCGCRLIPIITHLTPWTSPFPNWLRVVLICLVSRVCIMGGTLPISAPRVHVRCYLWPGQRHVLLRKKKAYLIRTIYNEVHRTYILPQSYSTCRGLCCPWRLFNCVIQGSKLWRCLEPNDLHLYAPTKYWVSHISLV